MFKLPSFQFSDRGLRIFALVVCAAVVAVVMSGLFVAGTPGNQRIRRLDQTRVDDLRSLRYAIDNYYADRKAVPPGLDDLNDPRYGAYRTVDPATGVPYEYHRIDQATYQLCAVFATDSSEISGDPRMSPYGLDEQFAHGVGRTCFTFNAAISSLGVCGPGLTCPTGNECALLPGSTVPRCVEKDQLCSAAGCAESCSIAESYPVQVRCPSPQLENEPAAGQSPSDDGVSTCKLMTDPKNGKIGCYGCANGRCSHAPASWQPYTPTEGTIGIPYACFVGESGCELAQ